MAVFSAYFDESGTHDDSSSVVVGGYVSTGKNWKKLRRAWQGLLKDSRVEILHRVDLETFHGDFKDWTREQQIGTVREGHKIIKEYTEKAIGAAVVHADFDEVMPDVIKRAFGGAYGWLVQDCMVGIGHWANDSNQKGFVQYVFETGARGRHQVEHMFSALFDEPKYRDLLRINGWSFQSKQQTIQLQSADWFAYEIYKHMDNRIVAGVRRSIRKSAWDLFRPTIDKAQYWDKARIKKWVESATNGGLIKLLENREQALRSIGREDLI